MLWIFQVEAAFNDGIDDEVEIVVDNLGFIRMSAKGRIFLSCLIPHTNYNSMKFSSLIKVFLVIELNAFHFPDVT